MSALKSAGYGDGRTTGAMPNGDFCFPEHNGRSGSGIVVDGAQYALAGQPPMAQSHGWGNIGWFLFSPRQGAVQQSGRSYPRMH